MDLREYLFHKRLTVVEFSKIVDYSRDHISRIIHGHKTPSKKLARAIEKATDGEVKAESLLKKSNIK